MNKIMEKPCPEGKIRNPSTGRCINKDVYDKKIKKEKAAQAAQTAQAAQAAQTAQVVQVVQSPLIQNNKKIIENLKILADFERINKEY
jgi:hypothetical protein